MGKLNDIFKKSKFFNKKYISLTLILFIVFLGTPTVAKATVFEPSNMDKSIEYLTAIFGNKINNRLISEDSIQVNTFLANLFQIFNTVVLSIAILILAYVAIISTLNTAQEGQVMGKKWSSVWIPLRSSMGLLMLAPLPGTGYSCLQVIVMWIVLNGVGAADVTWNFVLSNLSQGISISQKEQLNTESLNNINNQSQELAKSLFNSLACIKILNNKITEDNLKLSYYIKPDDHQLNIDNLTLSNKIIFGLNNDAETAAHRDRANICGELNIQASLDPSELTNQNDEEINLTPDQKVSILGKIYYIKQKSI
ncbi:MAG: DotA/TraY family protein [Gammaproteobacteria bacterium]